MALFSKTKTIPFQDIRTPEAQQLGKTVLRQLQAGAEAYTPGAEFGDVSVGLTQPEQQSLGFLSQYLQGDVTTDPLYQAGRAEISGTLEGKFDPTTGQFYKATRAGMQRAQEEAIEQARRGQSVRGAFRSTGALRQEGDILTDSAIAQQRLLGELAERERERRGAAAGQAMNIAQFEAGIPLSKTQAAQTYGALERENEIQNLEREYKKWADQRRELSAAFTTAGTASNLGQPLYGRTSTTVTEPTVLGELTNVALQAFSAFGGGGAQRVSTGGGGGYSPSLQRGTGGFQQANIPLSGTAGFQFI